MSVIAQKWSCSTTVVVAVAANPSSATDAKARSDNVNFIFIINKLITDSGFTRAGYTRRRVPTSSHLRDRRLKVFGIKVFASCQYAHCSGTWLHFAATISLATFSNCDRSTWLSSARCCTFELCLAVTSHGCGPTVSSLLRWSHGHVLRNIHEQSAVVLMCFYSPI